MGSFTWIWSASWSEAKKKSSSRAKPCDSKIFPWFPSPMDLLASSSLARYSCSSELNSSIEIDSLDLSSSKWLSSGRFLLLKTVSALRFAPILGRLLALTFFSCVFCFWRLSLTRPTYNRMKLLRMASPIRVSFCQGKYTDLLLEWALKKHWL